MVASIVALPAVGQAQARRAPAPSRAVQPMPNLGSVRIGGDDARHPYTSRSALATRSRTGRIPVSLDLPSLANVHQSARNVLLAARGFMGTPYVWGGESPGGFDCSGFTRYVFGLVGVAIPRSSRQQIAAGDPVPTRLSALEAGDLIFFANAPSEPISHVAIYAGSGRMIHASGRGRAVRVDDLTAESGRWYLRHMVAVRRVLAAPGVAASQ